MTDEPDEQAAHDQFILATGKRLVGMVQKLIDKVGQQEASQLMMAATLPLLDLVYGRPGAVAFLRDIATRLESAEDRGPAN